MRLRFIPSKLRFNIRRIGKPVVPLSDHMKKLLISTVVALSAALLFTGCVASVGSGTRSETHNPTLGQQLMDLQKARDSGAITQEEYQTQKAKLLEHK